MHKIVSPKKTPSPSPATPKSGIYGKVDRWSEREARGIGPVYSPDHALQVTYGNVPELFSYNKTNPHSEILGLATDRSYCGKSFDSKSGTEGYELKRFRENLSAN
jgi:hypothetical protein